ncbi:MAG: secretion system protein, partial [Haloarcula sp.]
MAIDDTGGSGSEQGTSGGELSAQPVRVGEYTWDDLRRELHDGGRFDRSEYLGFEPRQLTDRLEDAASAAKTLQGPFDEYLDPSTTPVAKDVYTWEHFKQEYYYEDGSQPRDGDGNVVPLDKSEYLGFEPDHTENRLAAAEDIASELHEYIDENTVDVNPELDEDEFFSTRDGHTTVVNRYDLEKAVPTSKKSHFSELERYWVNKPYACVVIFHSQKENEKKYYVIEPYLNPIELDLREFLSGKLKTAIKYSEDDVIVQGTDADRAQVIQREAEQLLSRYDLYDGSASSASADEGVIGQVKELFGLDGGEHSETAGQLTGISTRPEPAIIEDDDPKLNEYQVEKLLYMLKRDFVGYARI